MKCPNCSFEKLDIYIAGVQICPRCLEVFDIPTDPYADYPL